MFGTYKPDDVVLLLKDITGLVEPQPASVRERLIQSGTHYCEMLPLEYKPSEPYFQTFCRAVEMYAGMTADAVAAVAAQIVRRKGKHVTLVSLARAGTPIGILIKRYMAEHLHVNAAHYAVSIIRGRGIDRNAMDYILRRHGADTIQFVDGWTGKGAISRQLAEAMRDYPGVDPSLAVLSDPAHIAGICGTHDDFLIPSSCLNSTVSGLLSRTFLRSDIIGPDDFHGAAFYRELLAEDVTYRFIDRVIAAFPSAVTLPQSPEGAREEAMAEVVRIQRAFGIRDINLVKPGIGEATRVLLRRLPWKVLVHSLEDKQHLGHLYQLAREKGVELIPYPLKYYRACGLIREMADT
ncbi:MAG: cysteine protease StiP family protein [Aristaeellaceae bacterium]